MTKTKFVYYGITEDESKQEYIEYGDNNQYDGKGINLDLKGLRNFIIDSNLETVIKYYFITNLDNFAILENIYKNDKYNMITVKIPFKIKVTKVFNLFD